MREEMIKETRVKAGKSEEVNPRRLDSPVLGDSVVKPVHISVSYKNFLFIVLCVMLFKVSSNNSMYKQNK